MFHLHIHFEQMYLNHMGTEDERWKASCGDTPKIRKLDTLKMEEKITIEKVVIWNLHKSFGLETPPDDSDTWGFNRARVSTWATSLIPLCVSLWLMFSYILQAWLPCFPTWVCTCARRAYEQTSSPSCASRRHSLRSLCCRYLAPLQTRPRCTNLYCSRYSFINFSIHRQGSMGGVFHTPPIEPCTYLRAIS